MNKLRQILFLIVYLATLNFVLFFGSSLVLGGSSLDSKIEAGHYFVGDHGSYTEVWWPIYALSWLQGVSVCVSWPVVMLAMLSLSLSDPCRVRIHLGGLYNGIERFFGRAFDEWRTPSVEFFTRLQPAACLARLEAALTDENLRYYFRRSFVILTGSTEFDLISPSHGLNPLLVLHGKLTPTPQGTYVRAWHRFSMFGTLFLSIFGLLLVYGLLGWLIWWVLVYVFQVETHLAWSTVGSLRILILIGWIGGLGIAILVGGVFGRLLHKDWGWFLEDALTRKPPLVSLFDKSMQGLSPLERLQKKHPEAFAQAKRKRDRGA